MAIDAAKQVQSNLLRAAKSPEPGERFYRTRDWSLFVFFRIMTDVEVNESRMRLREVLAQIGKGDIVCPDRLFEVSLLASNGSDLSGLMADLAQPNLHYAGLADERRRRPKNGDSASVGPDWGFFNWLSILVDADPGTARKRASFLTGFVSEGRTASAPSEDVKKGAAILLDKLADRMGAGGMWSIPFPESEDQEDKDEIAEWLTGVAGHLFGRDAESDEQWLELLADPTHCSPLLRLLVYEFLRQLASPFLTDSPVPLIRSEADEDGRQKDERFAKDGFDRTSITLAFTYSGLEALKLDDILLESFPDVFKEGMAARAERLRDIGASAPENWEGELGLKSVHGFFSSSSNLHGHRPGIEANFYYP